MFSLIRYFERFKTIAISGLEIMTLENECFAYYHSQIKHDGISAKFQCIYQLKNTVN